MGLQLGDADGVGGEVSPVDESLGEEDVQHPVDQRDVGAGLTGRCRSAIIAVFVTRGSTTMTRGPPGPIRRGATAVVVGHVGAEQHDQLGLVEVVVAARRPSLPKASL